MNLAIIDCGTNTFNLIVVRVTGKSTYERLYQSRIPVKLGDSAYTTNCIEGAARERAIGAFKEFIPVLREFKVARTFAYGTAAIRDAENRKEFIAEIADKFGIEIGLIDGEREAELVYFGIREAVKLGNKPVLVMDMGGGSTEFIIAKAKRLLWKKSYKLGAALILHKFKPSDPISKNEIESIYLHFRKELESLAAAIEQFKPVSLIGSSGAFESLVEMIHGELGGELFSSEKTSYEIRLDDYRKICGRIVASTLEERKQIQSLVPMRQDMIVVFCLILNFVLDEYGFDSFSVSAYSLKEGVIADFLKHLD